MRREQSSFTPLQLLIKGTESEVTAVNAQLCVHFSKRMFPLININFAANVTFKKKKRQSISLFIWCFLFSTFGLNTRRQMGVNCKRKIDLFASDSVGLITWYKCYWKGKDTLGTHHRRKHCFTHRNY